MGINSSETDFQKIYDTFDQLNPEEDIIEDVDDLSKAKAYMIVLQNGSGDEVIGYKRLPESWKPKRERGLIPLLFRENQFEDLEDQNVFSISNTIEMAYFQDTLFILSVKAFEHKQVGSNTEIVRPGRSSPRKKKPPRLYHINYKDLDPQDN